MDPSAGPTLDELKAHIERFAPAEYAGEREKLYKDILHEFAKQDPTASPEDCEGRLVYLLMAMVVRRGFAQVEEQERHSQQQLEDYWAERERIQRQLEAIAQHPFVRSFDSRSVEFYKADEVDCVHGRRRKRCEHLRSILEYLNDVHAGQLLTLVQLRQLGILPAFQNVFLRRISEQLSSLRKAGVSPHASPSDFCAVERVWPYEPIHGHLAGSPDTEYAVAEMINEQGPALHRRKHGGSPPDPLVGPLLAASMPVFIESGIPIQRACEYMQRLLLLCLGVEADAAALERRWYRERDNIIPSDAGGQ